MRTDRSAQRRAPPAADRNPAAGLLPMLAVGGVLLIAVAVAWFAFERTGLRLGDERALREWVEGLGAWGPAAIVGLMTMAIVMSPIPSAPIALVAGAAYGPLWGTLYIVAGAEAGAIVAFWIARCLGYEALRRWAPAGRWMQRLAHQRSQSRLMAVVFASRLIPFVSFDVLSYAAGLTPLAFWRFALATLAGVVPLSFALAYFGESIVESGSRWMMLFALSMGLVTLGPFVLRALRRRRAG